jgi:hypothetical protein
MIDWMNAVVAGVVGAIALALMTDLSRGMGLIDANLTRYQGCIVTGRHEGALPWLAGLAMHLGRPRLADDGGPACRPRRLWGPRRLALLGPVTLAPRRAASAFHGKTTFTARGIMGRNTRDGTDVLDDLVKGALAGVAATWVMGQATTYLYEHESKWARKAEDEARGNTTAYDVAAEKAAGAVGVELSEEQRQQAGMAIHWALGAGAGAVYGVLRNRLPGADAGAGLLFGTGFWLVIDEGANYALRLTPGPTAFPWQTHGRGLAGHLVFGVAAHAALKAMDAIA